MTKHHVKSWLHFFKAINDGVKTHDLRKNDRNYKIGDTLILEEYDNINGRYTGRTLEREITYITSEEVPCAFSSAALEKGYCILSLAQVGKKEPSFPERPKELPYKPVPYPIGWPPIADTKPIPYNGYRSRTINGGGWV